MKHPLRAVLVIVAALCLLSLDHGLPHRYVPDDSVVKASLGMARDLADQGAAALVPPAGTYTTYPYGLPYFGLGMIGGRFAWGRVTGEWGGPGEYAERVFDDPTLAWLPVRFGHALLALLLPLATYRAARELGRRKGQAAVAALLAGSSLLFVQYAHTTRPWAPLVALGAATLAASLRLRRRRGRPPVLAAFALAGLTASTHPVGLAALGLPLAACLLWRARLLAVAGGLVAGLAVALALGFPFMLVDGLTSGSDTLVEGAAVQVGGQPFDPTAFTGDHFVTTAVAWLGYDPVLVLGGLLGLWLMRRGTDVRSWWLVSVPAAAFAVLFLVYDGTHVRYLMPLVPFLALGAAELLGRLAAGRAAWVAALLLALPLVQAARFDLVLGRTDTRTLAARALPDLVPPGDVVALDGYGSYYGPPLPATAASLVAVMDEVELNRSERRAIARAEAGLPEPAEARDVVPVERYYRFDSYYATDHLLGGPLEIDAFMRGRGVDVYVQVDRWPDEARRRPITDMTAARGERLATFSPTGSPTPARAQLPTDMTFALTELWRYERPGPWIRVWRLAP